MSTRGDESATSPPPARNGTEPSPIETCRADAGPRVLCESIDAQIGPDRLYPISFSIPETLTAQTVPEKTKDLAGGQSRGRKVYKYGVGQEADYHADYRASRFGLTYRKGGFDCMRHLEIMANGCLPFFPGHLDIPRLTMAHYPKAAIAQAFAMGRGNGAQGLLVDGFELAKKQPGENLLPKAADYQELAQGIINHVRTHLTTTAMARYVLKQMRQPDAQSVLFLGDGSKADHTSNLLFHGLRSLLGPACVDAPKLAWMYEDFPAAKCHKLHGRGFTYARKLPAIDINRTQIARRIKKQAFDLIVFGSVHRRCSLLHLARRFYDREQIALIDGEDHNRKVGTYRSTRPSHRAIALRRIPHDHIAHEGVYFKRELDDAFVIEFAARAPGPRKR